MIAYLRKNKSILNISAIERAARITYLKHVINNTPDGRGRFPTLADKHVQGLQKVLNDLLV